MTADNRYILYVNGTRVTDGPSRGTVARWRVRALDLAKFLKPGHNVIAAVVWNFGEFAPLAQVCVATGFRVTGPPLSTSEPGWRVRIDEGHGAVSGRAQIPWQYYVASTPEVIDAAKADWDFIGARESGAGWQDAVPAPAAAARKLVTDVLPPQSFTRVDAGRVVRNSLAGGEAFPAKAIVVPAHSEVKLLLRRAAMVSAYPSLTVSGGRGARIQVSYGEALYDAEGNKGDRDATGDRALRGFHDEFIADGGKRTFAPLWWRTFRFAEISVTTADDPLRLEAWRLDETGYPFERKARFHSSDPALDRIFDIGWRTLRVDAHETFMDSSYWEQLQYAGDTRLEMLISYAVSGDPRLAEQAIDAFAESNTDGGLVQGAYPSREPNVIATFSFAWVGMLSDWSRRQPDSSVIARHLPRMRTVLGWFGQWTNPLGLLGKNPQWNFIDWAGQQWNDRDHFPSWGKDNGSCLMTAMWVGALRQGAELERAYGDDSQAAADTVRADRAREAIRAHCWDARKGLFADDADLAVFSQHMNVFAVLYDIATPAQASGILDRITVPGHGIDAPPGMYASTYYFAWYLVRAFEHVGRADRYPALLETWRDLLPLHFTTWPESRQHPRSDSHAWSAHPTADLLGLVAGIQPAAPGYARLRVAPLLGDLTLLDATAMTPFGPVTVSYRVKGGELAAVIERPAKLPGVFEWMGRVYPLAGVKTRFTLPAR